jgi:ubiquinone/menaquinone biosynthesis C-methylase UbiE
MSVPEIRSADDLIREHYRKVAENHGTSPRSSMEDDYIREQELAFLTGYFSVLMARAARPMRVLDLGCGNGIALTRMLPLSRDNDLFWGIDFSPELLEIARSRNLPRCTHTQGDARDLAFESGFFDFAYTERCLINILDGESQETALNEIARVLKPGGTYLMIECFNDGLENSNKARADCGLPPISVAYHNKYFDKRAFLDAIRPTFEIVESQSEFAMPSNFLSSYYFVSRVLYPALTKGEVVRNSEVAKFFSFFPPVGNYASIQAYILRKKHA